MNLVSISESTFKKFTQLIYDEIGISISEHKKSLIESRFFKRLILHNLDSYDLYLDLCLSDADEKAKMLDLITTNETYFFRESTHFDFLKEYLLEYTKASKVRIWSAASSVGAEAYSIAMTCDSFLPINMYEIIGTDINKDVIKKARMGLYPLSWADKISVELRHKYCLKGKGKYEGQFLVDRQLAKNVRFLNYNLLESTNELGKFDIVFLRNVLIYFDTETRVQVLQNILHNMRDNAYLIISKTENLNGLGLNELVQIQPSIFQYRRLESE